MNTQNILFFFKVISSNNEPKEIIFSFESFRSINRISFSIFFILRWFGNILGNNNVTLSDELEVGYYVTLFLIMYADDAALLAVCK
jgi:hypothetical protein